MEKEAFWVEDRIWNLFLETGMPEAYLAYKMYRKTKRDEKGDRQNEGIGHSGDGIWRVG